MRAHVAVKTTTPEVRKPRAYRLRRSPPRHAHAHAHACGVRQRPHRLKHRARDGDVRPVTALADRTRARTCRSVMACRHRGARDWHSQSASPRQTHNMNTHTHMGASNLAEATTRAAVHVPTMSAMDSPRACAHSHHQDHIRMKERQFIRVPATAQGVQCTYPLCRTPTRRARTAACAHMHTRHGRDHETRDRQIFPPGPCAARGLHIPPVATVEEANTHTQTPTHPHAHTHARTATHPRAVRPHHTARQNKPRAGTHVLFTSESRAFVHRQGVIRTPKRIRTPCTHILHPIRRSIFNCKQAQTHAYTRR